MTTVQLMDGLVNRDCLRFGRTRVAFGIMRIDYSPCFSLAPIRSESKFRITKPDKYVIKRVNCAIKRIRFPAEIVLNQTTEPNMASVMVRNPINGLTRPIEFLTWYTLSSIVCLPAKHYIKMNPIYAKPLNLP